MANKRDAAAPVDSVAKARPNTVQLIGEAGTTSERVLAEAAAAGVLGNASTLVRFSKGTLGDLDLTESMRALASRASAASRGDLSAAEGMLMAQASALDSIFTELARRAALNMGEYLGATESYLRLALKAQGQCRATLETVAEIRQGPTIFARQANIAQGHQQVNNNAAPAADARAGAVNPKSAKSKLLGNDDGERLDTGKEGAAGGSDPAMETVETIDRAAHR